MAAQEDIRYQLQVNGKTRFEVVEFTHKERLSELFKTELKLVSKDTDPEFADILDNSATLTLHQGGEAVRYINGIVTHLEQGKSGIRRTHYRMVIEPALARCALTADSRHFQNKTIVEIITLVLEENGLHHIKFTEVAMHPVKREFCQQYRETDLAFIQRLAAEEGFFFYFEHSDKQHSLHFANHLQAAHPTGTLLYNANPAGDRPVPCLWKADYRERIAPTKMAMKDYTFTHPDYRLKHQAEARNHETFDYEIFDSPGRFKRDAAGKPFTQVRLEELRRETITINAEGDDMRVKPGYRMTLKGHARKDLNAEWTFIDVDHHGYQPGVLGEEADTSAAAKGSFYRYTVIMVPWHSQWRATTQHKPRVDGPQIATVVGPAGEEIYCDEWGRVKLQFEYDRYGKFDEFSSCWIRVSQGWAGTKFGGMAIPRIGQEVIVDFLEGDPDQPIVTGRTYNANNYPPYPLPANKTRMSIKSQTHKGEGYNELRFEDEKGQEQIFTHAQKDQDIIIKNDRKEHIQHDRDLKVDHDRREQIDNDSSSSVGGERIVTTAKKMSIAVGDDAVTRIGKKYHMKTGQSQYFQASQNIVIEAASAITLRASGGFIKIDASGLTVQGKITNINTGGSPEQGVSVQGTVAHKVMMADSRGATAPPEAAEPPEVDVPMAEVADNSASYAEPTSISKSLESAFAKASPLVPLVSDIETGLFDEAMIIMDKKTSKGLADYPYLIETPEGGKLFGRTDDKGHISRFLTGSRAKKLKVCFGDEALYRNDLKMSEIQ